MGAAPAQLLALNRGAAAMAWRPCSAIHRCLSPVVAIDAFQISEVTERCASSTDAFFQHLNQAETEIVELLCIQFSRRRLWGNSRSEETFIGINIPCPRHEALIR